MMMREATIGEKLDTTGVRQLKRFVSSVIVWGLLACVTPQAWAQQPTDQRTQSHPTQQNNMRLVGFNDLQGRSSYQPIIHRQGQRWIAYIGTHKGNTLNSLTGVNEGNGTLIVDVTDPRNPATLFHIPGNRGNPENTAQAQMVRACDIGGQTFLLRTSSRTRHEITSPTPTPHSL